MDEACVCLYRWSTISMKAYDCVSWYASTFHVFLVICDRNFKLTRLVLKNVKDNYNSPPDGRVRARSSAERRRDRNTRTDASRPCSGRK
jgi:hypothetical protein